MILTEYQNSLAIRNYQPNTLYRHVRLATRFLDSVSNDVSRITTQSIEVYLYNLLEDGKSIKTIKNYLSGIKVFCDFLVGRGHLSENPVHHIPSMEMPEEIPVCLSPDEIKLAYSVGKRHDIYCEVALALNTGLRLQEMRQLQWPDVDMERRQLVVRKAKGKRPRNVPINQTLLDAFKCQYVKYHHLLFVFPGGEVGGHIKGQWNQPTMRGVSWWQKRSVKILQRELPTLRDLPAGRTGRGWHIFRHTFATQCIKSGIDVVKLRDWMGHRKIETTLRYIHVARHYDSDIEMLNLISAA